jgi:hypothetical protein
VASDDRSKRKRRDCGVAGRGIGERSPGDAEKRAGCLIANLISGESRIVIRERTGREQYAPQKRGSHYQVSPKAEYAPQDFTRRSPSLKSQAVAAAAVGVPELAAVPANPASAC